MEKLLLRAALILLLLFIGYNIQKEREKMEMDQNAETQGEKLDTEGKPPKRDKANPMALLTYYVLFAAGLGFIVLKWVVPAFSDKVSQAFLGSNEAVELDDNAKVMVLVSQGNYEKAIEEFSKLAVKNPTDRFPVIEMAKLQKEKLHDPGAAIQVYDDALNREWPDDDAGFFKYKAAEIYLELQDTTSAKQLLNDIIQSHPGTGPAGNANHKLRELEEAEFIAARSKQ